MGIWDKNKKREKSPFEASLVLDTDEVKIVEAQYGDKPIFIGFGVAKKQSKGAKAEGSLMPLSVGGSQQYEREYDWRLFYNPNNMPGFLPTDKVESLVSGAVALTSGSPHALQAHVEPLPEEELELNEGIVISGKGIKIKKKKGSSLEI